MIFIHFQQLHTSTVFTVGGEDGGNSSNANGGKYVGYCWSEIPGIQNLVHTRVMEVQMARMCIWA